MTTEARSRRDRMAALSALWEEPHESERPQLKSDINVTPLVDVVLVLLIIFMVVTPMIASGVAVDLPKTANHSRKPDDGKDLIISLTHDSRVYVGGTRIDRVENLGQVVENQLKNSGKTVFLKGDARAPFGIIRKAMQSLHERKIKDITLGTEEKNKDH
jgi:biopolymer transport protein TolR